MPDRCVVYGCDIVPDISKGISVHRIPFWNNQILKQKDVERNVEETATRREHRKQLKDALQSQTASGLESEPEQDNTSPDDSVAAQSSNCFDTVVAANLSEEQRIENQNIFLILGMKQQMAHMVNEIEIDDYEAMDVGYNDDRNEDASSGSNSEDDVVDDEMTAADDLYESGDESDEDQEPVDKNM
eukprot:gene4195-20382_t